MLQATNRITLKNVKKSDYWNLIALIVWNHFSEKTFQNENLIQITEEWFGVSKDGKYYLTGPQWNSRTYTFKDFKRTLCCIKLTLTRHNYTVYIKIYTDGNITHSAQYNQVSTPYTPQFYPKALDLMNWCIKNNFLNLVHS